MMYGFLIGIIIILLIVVVSSRQSPYSPGAWFPTPTKTMKQEYEDLEAERLLRENYTWVKPRYAGYYLGEKIQKKDPRIPELLRDVKFCRATGHWEPRKKDK